MFNLVPLWILTAIALTGLAIWRLLSWWKRRKEPKDGEDKPSMSPEEKAAIWGASVAGLLGYHFLLYPQSPDELWEGMFSATAAGLVELRIIDKEHRWRMVREGLFALGWAYILIRYQPAEFRLIAGHLYLLVGLAAVMAGFRNAERPPDTLSTMLGLWGVGELLAGTTLIGLYLLGYALLFRLAPTMARTWFDDPPITQEAWQQQADS